MKMFGYNPNNNWRKAQSFYLSLPGFLVEKLFGGDGGGCGDLLSYYIKKALTYYSYLVDPASSHMLVSKTKPCMYKYRPILRRNREWLIKSVVIHWMWIHRLLG